MRESVCERSRKINRENGRAKRLAKGKRSKNYWLSNTTVLNGRNTTAGRVLYKNTNNICSNRVKDDTTRSASDRIKCDIGVLLHKTNKTDVFRK